MNTDFVVGGLLLWIVIAIIEIIAHYQSLLHDQLREEDDRPWGAVALKAFLWPILLAGFFVKVVIGYWREYRSVRDESRTDVWDSDIEPCLSLRERALIAYKFHEITGPEINRVLLLNATLSEEVVFAARRSMDAANVPMYERQLRPDQHDFLARCA